MSDDFFEKYYSLHSGDDAASPAGQEAQAAYSAEPEQPAAAPAPAAATTRHEEGQSSYFAPASADPAGIDTNPYSGRPVTDAAAHPVQENRSAYPGANTFVDANGFYHRSFTEHRTPPAHTPRQPAPRHDSAPKARMPKGAIAILLVVCVLISGAAGFGGSMLAARLNADSKTASADSTTTVSGQLVVHKVDVTNASDTDEQLVDKSTDEITRSVADAVVEITTEVVQTNSFYGQYISTGAGSGVIISDDGYIVTNNHVIEDASNITVTLRSGESYDAQFIGTDADEDVALLKIEADNLTTAVFGDSSTLEVGDKAVIIGNPLGTLGGSVTEGIVSALDRSIVIDGKTMHLMQTDAAINPGNSGGGMFNGQGELVGIVVAKSGGTASGSTIDNIGFVIPINNVLNILGDLKQYGYVRGKADTGMSFVDITNEMYAWYYFNSSSTGVFISSVDRGSNAAEAGFSAGDRVISVDGKKVKTSSEISEIISSHSAGDTVTFELERGSRTGSIDLTLEEYVPSRSTFNK